MERQWLSHAEVKKQNNQVRKRGRWRERIIYGMREWIKWIASLTTEEDGGQISLCVPLRVAQMSTKMTAYLWRSPTALSEYSHIYIFTLAFWRVLICASRPTSFPIHFGSRDLSRRAIRNARNRPPDEGHELTFLWWPWWSQLNTACKPHYTPSLTNSNPEMPPFNQKQSTACQALACPNYAWFCCFN